MDLNKIIRDKSCDICKDKIGLYTPWYSVHIKGKLCIPGKDRPNPMTLCTNCYHAYENFLTEREVQENHKQNMMEMKGEKQG